MISIILTNIKLCLNTKGDLPAGRSPFHESVVV